MWGFQKQNIVFVIGKLIFDCSLRINIGELMFKYGGGGYVVVGICQIVIEDVDCVEKVLIIQINVDG